MTGCRTQQQVGGFQHRLLHCTAQEEELHATVAQYRELEEALAAAEADLEAQQRADVLQRELQAVQQELQEQSSAGTHLQEELARAEAAAQQVLWHIMLWLREVRPGLRERAGSYKLAL